MKLSTVMVQKLIITDVPGLDPISVYLEDLGPGAGKATITCFNDCWSRYWSHMGEQYDIRSFLLKTDQHYLAGKFSPKLDNTVPDFSGLVDAAKKQICRQRRGDDINKETARDIFDRTEELEGAEDCRDLDSDLMHDIFGYEWWYSMPQQSNHHYDYLCLVINTVKEALRQAS